MNLKQTLLTPEHHKKNKFNAVLDAHGFYTTEQFSIRLSPKNHQLIDKFSEKNYNSSECTIDEIQAYSTYLHETIHWWQHVGSTSGLLLSLCYPNQVHSNYYEIKEWCTLVSPCKSIQSWAKKGEYAGRTHENHAQKLANIIVNNTMDIKFFKEWLFHPENFEKIYNNTYFESQGHCFSIAYGSLISNISPIIDPNLSFLPDVESWDSDFSKMNKQKVLGYYHGSPIIRKKVGVVDIFEGQACFSQMQYLSGAMKSNPDLSSFKKAGMLHGVYETAFKEFIEITDLDYPSSALDPTIALFLLICDISINPTEGFPCSIIDFPNFVHYNDPGIRFQMLCLAASKNKNIINGAIKSYSKEEYMEVSYLLTKQCGLKHPQEAWDEIKRWLEKPLVQSLMKEKKTFKYSNENIILRVMLSHFIAFTIDKSENPEFFCWSGYWKSKGGTKIKSLWLRNLSLFSDKEKDNGIFMRMFPGKKKEELLSTYNRFFTNIIFCDLSHQWILQDGSFSFDFKWLSEKHSAEEFKGYAEQMFNAHYGLNIADILQTP